MAPDGRICAIPARDAGAFERVYDEHSGRLLSVAYRVLGDPALAQDVVHDVFLGLWRDPSSRGSVNHTCASPPPVGTRQISPWV